MLVFYQNAGHFYANYNFRRFKNHDLYAKQVSGLLISLRKGQTGRQTGTEVMTDNSLTVIVKRRIVAGRRKQGDRHRLRKGLIGRHTGT